MLSVASLNAYLAFGFVPDFEKASADWKSLRQRVLAAPGAGDPLGRILSRCVERQTIARGHKQALLTLTGGYDSGGLLGCCLDMFSTKDLIVGTWGDADSNDLLGASARAKRFGLQHVVIAHSGIAWDYDELVSLAAATFRRLGHFPRYDYLYFARLLENEVGPDVPVMSGYLGCMVSGANLWPGQQDEVGDIIRFNLLDRAQEDDPDVAAYRAAFSNWDADHERAGSSMGLFTAYDRMDIAFRQFQRIRPAVLQTYRNGFSPYEDPEWIAAWTRIGLELRLDQKIYRRFLAEAYGKVFDGDPTFKTITGYKHTKRSLPDRINRRIVGRFRKGTLRDWTTTGDPRTNRSYDRFLQKCLSEFDKRRGADAGSFLKAYERCKAAPAKELWHRIAYAVSAQLYHEAGVGL